MIPIRAAKDFLFVAAPKVAGGVCFIALNIALMNWLGREAFGAYSLCLAAIALLGEGMFAAAIDMGVMRLASAHLPDNPRQALAIERRGFRLKLQLMAGLTLPAIVASVPISHHLFQRSGLAHLVPITCAAALGMLVLGSVLLHLQLRGKFKQYGALDLLHLVVKFGGIGLLLLIFSQADEISAPGLVLAMLAAGPLAAITAFVCSHPEILDQTGGTSAPSGTELLGFVKWFLATLVVASLVSRLDLFLLASLAPIADVGIFAGGQTVASIPMLIGTYLAVVFNPRVIPACRQGLFFRMLCQVQSVLFTLSAISYGLVLAFGGGIFSHYLPESFRSSQPIILILLPATLAGMTSYPLAVSFLMFARPKFLLVVDLVLLVPLLIGQIVLISRYGAIGAAVGTCAFGLIKTAIAQFAAFYWAKHLRGEFDWTGEIDALAIQAISAPVGTNPVRT